MITCGFMYTFQGSDTLLFVCDRPGIRYLAGLCDVFGQALSEAPIDLSADKKIAVAAGQRIVISHDEDKCSSATAYREPMVVQVKWHLSNQCGAKCKALLLTLADSNGAAHTYLEEEGDIVIMVSVGEYPPDIVATGI